MLQTEPFFTSDPHLGHYNCIAYCNRPFQTAHEMNQAIIDNWNKIVGPNDSVFLLGDVSFQGVESTAQMLKHMHGKKYLIAGNHDAKRRKQQEFIDCFEWVKDYYELEIKDHDAPASTQLIVMMHYPMLSWRNSRHGSWQLHGHCHGSINKLNENGGYKRLDVGVDSHNFTPVSYQQVKRIMRTRFYNTDA